MAKPDTLPQAAPEQVEAAASAAVTLSLDEFCARLSETVRSPEIIGAFHFTERTSGVPRDTFDAYKARFDAFRNQPV